MTQNYKFEIEALTLEETQLLHGLQDQNLKLLKQAFNQEFILRDNILQVNTHDAKQAQLILDSINAFIRHIKQNQSLDERDVIYLSQCVIENAQEQFFKVSNQLIGRTVSGKPIYAKTLGQSRFIDALKDYECVIASGPAGTGKTYLSVVYAVSLLKKAEIKKIILTRPVVEAGENLGFLPGDLKEKIDPYLRPLYDALNDVLGIETVDKMIEKGVIEIAPLAYMRGRTFDDSYVILDEAQNTTKTQMLMFLTRMGFHTRLVVTGDVTQIDLRQSSGLTHAKKVLKDIPEIKFIELNRMDIVRHPLVQKIIESYEKDEKNG
ncbi:MAG TPA: PhoH family protein [Erysipelotrichaceae bacterium]|nr:PhoH family protein [Erysipelotrichaceae bacterium]